MGADKVEVLGETQTRQVHLLSCVHVLDPAADAAVKGLLVEFTVHVCEVGSGQLFEVGEVVQHVLE